MFFEQYNGDYRTDYVRAFWNVTIKVRDNVEEQFAITPGDIYYFDLSAQELPGVVNDKVPDSMLHYVPFTYVGTVGAYAMENKSDTSNPVLWIVLFFDQRCATAGTIVARKKKM